MAAVTTTPVPVTYAPAPVATPPAAPAVAVAPAAAPREAHVQSAVSFLSNPRVVSSPAYDRVTFLERKGLTTAEIAEALKRVAPNASETKLLQDAVTLGLTPSQAVASLAPAATTPASTTTPAAPAAVAPAAVATTPITYATAPTAAAPTTIQYAIPPGYVYVGTPQATAPAPAPTAAAPASTGYGWASILMAAVATLGVGAGAGALASKKWASSTSTLTPAPTTSSVPTSTTTTTPVQGTTVALPTIQQQQQQQQPQALPVPEATSHTLMAPTSTPASVVPYYQSSTSTSLTTPSIDRYGLSTLNQHSPDRFEDLAHRMTELKHEMSDVGELLREQTSSMKRTMYTIQQSLEQMNAGNKKQAEMLEDIITIKQLLRDGKSIDNKSTDPSHTRTISTSSSSMYSQDTKPIPDSRDLYQEGLITFNDTLTTLKQSCTHDELKTAISTMLLYISNILSHMDAPKYRKILVTNATYDTRIRKIRGAESVLLAAGFENRHPYMEWTPTPSSDDVPLDPINIQHKERLLKEVQTRLQAAIADPPASDTTSATSTPARPTITPSASPAPSQSSPVRSYASYSQVTPQPNGNGIHTPTPSSVTSALFAAANEVNTDTLPSSISSSSLASDRTTSPQPSHAQRVSTFLQSSDFEQRAADAFVTTETIARSLDGTNSETGKESILDKPQVLATLRTLIMAVRDSSGSSTWSDSHIHAVTDEDVSHAIKPYLVNGATGLTQTEFVKVAQTVFQKMVDAATSS